MSDNFPNIDQKQPEGLGFAMSDPNNTSLDMDDANLPSTGKTKIRPTADAPHPTEQEGYGYMSPALKDVGQAPGNGSGVLTDNNGQGNSSGIPAAKPIEPMIFGDPNDTSLDFKDGMDRNTVTVKGGGTGDIESYDYRKPNPMGE